MALDTGTIDGILDGFQNVAGVLGATDAGRALVAGIRARLAALAERTRALPRPRPTVACLEWIDPLFAMGNWGPELVALAGGDLRAGRRGRAFDDAALAGAARRRSGRHRRRAVRLRRRTHAGGDADAGRAPRLARRWRAVRAGRVYVADGNLYFNRSGPLLFDTPEILAEILHPAAFPPAHEGAVWRRWP